MPGPTAPKPRKSERIQRRRAARREEVIAAAMGIVGRAGVEGLTMAVLASELGCVPGAIYRYFQGKTALLLAMQEQALRELEAEMAAGAAGGTGPFGKLLGALQPVIQGAERQPARHRLLDELLSSPEVIHEGEELARANAALAPVLAFVQHLLAEAAAAGALAGGDAQVRTRLVWAALHGLDHFRKRDRAEPPQLGVAALVPAMLRTLLVGWGADPAAVERALG